MEMPWSKCIHGNMTVYNIANLAMVCEYPDQHREVHASQRHGAESEDEYVGAYNCASGLNWETVTPDVWTNAEARGWLNSTSLEVSGYVPILVSVLHPIC
nr:hypothetical protein CFP56_16957 [Quercus suber]